MSDTLSSNFSCRQLLRDPEVKFAGYRVPHPLKHQIDIKIQTTEESAPVTALSSALEELKEEIVSFEVAFKVLALHLFEVPG